MACVSERDEAIRILDRAVSDYGLLEDLRGYVVKVDSSQIYRC